MVLAIIGLVGMICLKVVYYLAPVVGVTTMLIGICWFRSPNLQGIGIAFAGVAIYISHYKAGEYLDSLDPYWQWR